MKTPKWFFKKGLFAWLLLPCSVIYYFISRIVFKLRSRHPLVSKRKIVCVGNILSGGVAGITNLISSFIPIKADVLVIIINNKNKPDTINTPIKPNSSLMIEKIKSV